MKAKKSDGYEWWDRFNQGQDAEGFPDYPPWMFEFIRTEKKKSEAAVLEALKKEIHHRVSQNEGMCEAEGHHPYEGNNCPRAYSNQDLLAALEEVRAKFGHDI